MRYDLLIKGGRVIDPSQGIDGVRDVAFSGGKVAAVEAGIAEGLATEVVDATGLIVTPGLIDLHVHIFWGASDWGIEPDPSSLARGVTTVLDAGTAGACNFGAFRRYVLERCATRAYALLNISTIGIPSFTVGELQDLRWADVEKTVETARANTDYIVGLKARLGQAQAGDNDLDALKCALEAAEALGKFVMIHVGNTVTSLEDLVALLRPGDVVTHCFHGRRHGVLDDAGRVIAGVKEAQERGVVFDVGHGMGSFAFATAEQALAQGFLPGNISSDLHFYSIRATVPDYLSVLSKFMYLGLSLDEVIRLSTESAARILGLGGRLGTLRVGAEGDATVMQLQEGRFTFTDTVGVSVEARRRLVPVHTVRAGRVYRPWLGALQTVGPI